MAKLPVFTQKTSPSSATEYLAQLDELLRRNKGGSTLQGYDTNSSYTPQNLGGNVSDPTGLGKTASQGLGKTVSQQYNDVSGTPTDINFKPLASQPNAPIEEQALLDSLIGIDPSTLPLEEQNGLQMILDSFAGSDYRPTPQPTPSIETPQNQSQMTPEAPGPTISPQTVPGQPTSQDPQRGVQPSPVYGPQRAPTVRQLPQGDNSSYPMAEYPSIKSSIDLNNATGFDQTMDQANRILNPASTPQNPVPTLTQQQVSSGFGIPMDAAKTLSGVTPQDIQDVNALKQSPDYASKLGQSFKDRVDTNIAQNSDRTVEQLQADNAWEPTPFKPTNTSKINPIRQFAGDAVSFVGDKLGIPEGNWSELVAGGPTKDFNKVSAADNIQISEPDPNMPMQPGAGIDALKGQYQSAQSTSRGMFQKPPMEQISGMNRQVGNVVGQTATAADQMKTPMPGNEKSFSSPPMSAPAMDLTQPINQPSQSLNQPTQSFNQPVQSNNQPTQSYSQPSQPNNQPNQSNNQNQSSNQSNNQSNNQPSQPSNQPSQPKPPAKPVTQPVATPTKYIPPNQPIRIPLSTYGVGSNQPAKPAPQSKPSTNIFTKIASAISNLFKRK